MGLTYNSETGIGERLSTAGLTLLILLVAYPVVNIIYNLWFHPLRHYPGPKLYAATLCTIYYWRIRGLAYQKINEIHEEYGPVVRLAPEELSYIDPRAWKEIYGHKTSNSKIPFFYKDLLQVGPEESGSPGLLRSEGAVHSRMRRTFNHAFSDKALKAQEPLIKSYVLELVNLCRRRLAAGQKDPGSEEGKIDMVKFHHYTTFDIMGALAFGESLHLLKKGEYSRWVSGVLSQVQSIAVFHAIARWPVVARAAKLFMSKAVKEGREEFLQYCVDKVDHRMSIASDRPDFWNLVKKNKAQADVSRGELYAIASDFMLAGSDTTSTLLTALLWYLCKNPDKMKKLTDEIRAFPSFDDLTLETLARIEYLHACIQEGLRLHPSVPMGNMRLVPKEGTVICNKYLPGYSGPFGSGRVIVQCSHLAAYWSPRYWHNPKQFVPERWLSNPPAEYADDNKAVFNPFGYGPRGCIGQNLAYHNARAILSGLLYHFDVSLVNAEENWNEQLIQEIWVATPLLVNLKEFQR